MCNDTQGFFEDFGFNTAPAVGKAAVEGSVTKKCAASVSAEVADDGPGTLTYEWVTVKGDASRVKFADRNAKSPTVTVKAAGDFAFALKASDDERVTTGEPVTVDVRPTGTIVRLP